MKLYKLTGAISVLALLIPVLAACGQAEEVFRTLQNKTPPPTETSSSTEKKARAEGEPVAGAQITVRLISLTSKSSGTLVAECVTDKNGEFSFNYNPRINPPEKLTFELTITPPKGTSYQLSEGKTNKVIIEVNTSADPPYQFIVMWEPERGRATQGVFAVSGRSST